MAWMNLEVHEACTLGDRDSLEDYLQSGKYDVNLRDAEWGNRTPLHWACTKGYVDCIKVLLEYGAKGTSRMDMGWTPAHSAAEAGKLNSLRALHTAGVSLNRKDKYGARPYDVSYTYGHSDCCAFFKQVAAELFQKKAKADAEISTEDSESDLSDYSDDGL